MLSEATLYESHMHTPLCKHAKGEPEEYAAVAEQRGLTGIIVTCHNPTNDGWGTRYRMDVSQFEDYVALVARAREAWTGRVDVRLGMECDYYPGAEAWLEDLLGRAEFHHVLGSVHPELAEYKDRYFNGDVFELQRTYFEHLAQAAESGLFDTLAHPDLVKNFEPAKWQLERLGPDIQHSLDRIAKTGVAMELNTSGLNKRVPEMNPGAGILAEMRERNIPVVIGADAHEPQRVGANYEEALDLLEGAGYRHISIFLARKRHEMTIDLARRSLKYPVA